MQTPHKTCAQDGADRITAASSAADDTPSCPQRPRPARRKSLAALLMAIPPGDPHDDRDFVRIR